MEHDYLTVSAECDIFMMHQGSNGRNGRACTSPSSDISDPGGHEHEGMFAGMRMFLGLRERSGAIRSASSVAARRSLMKVFYDTASQVEMSIGVMLA